LHEAVMVADVPSSFQLFNDAREKPLDPTLCPPVARCENGCRLRGFGVLSGHDARLEDG
jgi:hypothetical protein